MKLHTVACRGLLVQSAWLTAGSTHDFGARRAAFRDSVFQFGPGAEIYADKAYNDKEFEALLAEKHIKLLPIRKKNMKIEDNQEAENQRRGALRKHIETVFSMIAALMPRKISANSIAGYKRKVNSFIVAHNLNQYIRLSKGYAPHFNSGLGDHLSGRNPSTHGANSELTSPTSCNTLQCSKRKSL